MCNLIHALEPGGAEILHQDGEREHKTYFFHGSAVCCKVSIYMDIILMLNYKVGVWLVMTLACNLKPANGL